MFTINYFEFSLKKFDKHENLDTFGCSQEIMNDDDVL